MDLGNKIEGLAIQGDERQPTLPARGREQAVIEKRTLESTWTFVLPLHEAGDDAACALPRSEVRCDDSATALKRDDEALFNEPLSPPIDGSGEELLHHDRVEMDRGEVGRRKTLQLLSPTSVAIRRDVYTGVQNVANHLPLFGVDISKTSGPCNVTDSLRDFLAKRDKLQRLFDRFGLCPGSKNPTGSIQEILAEAHVLSDNSICLGHVLLSLTVQIQLMAVQKPNQPHGGNGRGTGEVGFSRVRDHSPRTPKAVYSSSPNKRSMVLLIFRASLRATWV